jgi:YegS/Rv2252/BmrU family lipid kinase
MTLDTLVIVNPEAGGGRALRSEALVARFLAAHDRDVQFTHSRSSQDVRDLAARAAASGYRYVVALGGDGAFHYVIEGLRGTETIAGFFPAGTGNDAARELDIPKDSVQAASAFLHSEPQPMDLVRVKVRQGRVAHYVTAGGMGLDAQAAHLANTRFKKWPGVTRYLAGALWTFCHEPAFELRAEIDGVPWSGRVIFGAVANARCYGSGIIIAPEARIDDGWLDLVLAGEFTWPRLLAAIPVVLTVGNFDAIEVQRFRCRRAVLQADRPAKVHGDGEVLGESPAEFEVLPGAVRVMTPRQRVRPVQEACAHAPTF